MSDAIASGPEVPIAQTVRPISVEEMPSRQPAFSAHSIMKKTRMPSHTTDMSIVRGYHVRHLSTAQLGTVKWKSSAKGKPARYVSLAPHVSGHVSSACSPCACALASFTLGSCRQARSCADAHVPA